MSLNWNVEKIDNYKQVCWLPTGEKHEDGTEKTRLNPVTEALIFGTMSVGLGSITDKNVDEFAARFRIIEKCHGAMLIKPGKGGKGHKPWYLTDEDFTAHIGLVCNVSNETRAKWAGRMFTNKSTSITEDYARSFRRSRETAAV